jgi:hypothetical protein
MNKVAKRSLLAIVAVAAFVGIFIYVNKNLYRFFAGTTSINVNISPVTTTVDEGKEFAVSVLMSGQEIHATDMKLVYDSSLFQYFKEYSPNQTGVIITDTLFETAPVIETVTTVDATHKMVRAVVLSKTGSVASQGTLGFKFKALKAGSGTIKIESSSQVTGKDASNNAVSYTLNMTDSTSTITVKGSGTPIPTDTPITNPTSPVTGAPQVFVVLQNNATNGDHIDVLISDNTSCTDNIRSQIYVYDSKAQKNIDLMTKYSASATPGCWSGNYPEVNKLVAAYMFYGSYEYWLSKGLPQYVKFRVTATGPLSNEIDLGTTIVNPTATATPPVDTTKVPTIGIPTATATPPVDVTKNPTTPTKNPTSPPVTIPPISVTQEPTLTAEPTDVTINPTDNPNDPNASELTFTIRFQGVTKTPKEGQRDQKVRITLDDGASQSAHMVTFKAQTDGTFKGTLTKVVDTSAKYAFLIKGPKHLTKRICVSNPTEQFGGQYHCAGNGSITLKKGANEINFSKVLLLAGDLPEQNGIIDSVDLAFIRQNFRTTDAEKLTRGDLNMDGIIDSQDFALVIAALGFKYDED